MTDEKLNRLVATIGEEAAKKVMDGISESKETLEALGVESKESAVAEILDETKKPAEVEEEAEEEEKEGDFQVKAFAVAVAKELGMKELSDLLTEQKKSIKELQDTVVELKKDDDEKIAEQFIDKSLGALIWQKERPSESEETVVSEEEVKTIKEPVSWVTEVM
jgi:Sec-independent protein translocase protein TatA